MAALADLGFSHYEDYYSYRKGHGRRGIKAIYAVHQSIYQNERYPGPQRSQTSSRKQGVRMPLLLYYPTN